MYAIRSYYAALLGREFRYDHLVAASGDDEDALITALERAEETQIVEEVKHAGRGYTLAREPVFSFTHALIQSTLIGNLSTLRNNFV